MGEESTSPELEIYKNEPKHHTMKKQAQLISYGRKY